MVMFLTSHFELGSCFDKYNFNLEVAFNIFPIHFYNKYRFTEIPISSQFLGRCFWPNIEMWMSKTRQTFIFPISKFLLINE